MRTLSVFVRTLRRELADPEFRVIAGLLAGLLFTGTIVYALIEGWSLLDALYFCVVTVTTVGYGDLYPTTDLGKAFTIVYILAGIGVVVVFASTLVSGMVRMREEDEAARKALLPSSGKPGHVRRPRAGDEPTEPDPAPDADADPPIDPDGEG